MSMPARRHRRRVGAVPAATASAMSAARAVLGTAASGGGALPGPVIRGGEPHIGRSPAVAGGAAGGCSSMDRVRPAWRDPGAIERGMQLRQVGPEHLKRLRPLDAESDPGAPGVVPIERHADRAELGRVEMERDRPARPAPRPHRSSPASPAPRARSRRSERLPPRGRSHVAGGEVGTGTAMTSGRLRCGRLRERCRRWCPFRLRSMAGGDLSGLHGGRGPARRRRHLPG